MNGVVAACLPFHNGGTDMQGHSLQTLHKTPCGRVPVPSLYSKHMDHLDGIRVCMTVLVRIAGTRMYANFASDVAGLCHNLSNKRPMSVALLLVDGLCASLLVHFSDRKALQHADACLAHASNGSYWRQVSPKGFRLVVLGARCGARVYLFLLVSFPLFVTYGHLFRSLSLLYNNHLQASTC